MQGTAWSTLAGLALLAVAATESRADDYFVGHDRKLERMIMANAANKVGAIRGPLDGEWREPSALARIATLSALDLSLHRSVTRQLPEPATAERSSVAKSVRAKLAVITVRSPRGIEHVSANASGG